MRRTFWYLKYKQHNRAHEMSATFPEVKGAPYWLGVSHLFCTGIGCEIDRLLAVKPAVEIRAWWMAARRHLAGGWERRQGEVHSDREAECPKYTPIQRQPWKFFLIESWTIPEILPVTSSVLRLSYLGLCHKKKARLSDQHLPNISISGIRLARIDNGKITHHRRKIKAVQKSESFTTLRNNKEN